MRQDQKITTTSNQVHQAEIKLDYLKTKSEEIICLNGMPESSKEDWVTNEKQLTQLITNKLSACPLHRLREPTESENHYLIS